MTDENIQQFTINWIIMGTLIFCLMSFAISFMYNNNPLGLGDKGDSLLGSTTNNLSTKLYNSNEDADVLLNITANTNPEASDQGSRDSVSSGFKTKGTGTGFFESMKIFIAWVLVGDIGKMLLSVFGGIIGFTAGYLIFKWIRNGI